MYATVLRHATGWGAVIGSLVLQGSFSEPLSYRAFPENEPCKTGRLKFAYLSEAIEGERANEGGKKCHVGVLIFLEQEKKKKRVSAKKCGTECDVGRLAS